MLKQILLFNLCFILMFINSIFAFTVNDYNNKDTINNYYSDKYRGWFAYEEPPKDNKTEVDNKTIVRNIPQQQPTENKRINKKPKINWDKVWNMHPDKFKKLLKDVETWAIMYPNEENVGNYLQLQKVAIDRSSRFMGSALLNVQKRPELSNRHSYPRTTFGQRAYAEAKLNIQKNTLEQYKEKYGLIYFFSPDCTYCKKQAYVLDYFINHTGWYVHYVDVTKHPDMKVRFNVQRWPSIFLAQRGSDNYIRLATGLTTFTGLRSRIHRTINYLEQKQKSYEFGQDDYMLKTMGIKYEQQQQ